MRKKVVQMDQSNQVAAHTADIFPSVIATLSVQATKGDAKKVASVDAKTRV
jgi:hypothetical protein